MNRTDRIKAALRGDATDRLPYGFWTHMPDIDHDPDRLAAATAAFSHRLELDFIKSMPNGFYCVEDWGCDIDFSDIARGGTGKVVRDAIHTPADWAKLNVLNIAHGAMGRELRHLEQLVREAGPDAPVLATAFSPMTIANKLSGGAHRAHLTSDARLVEQGLEIITEVTCAFVRAAIDRGCAGIFFATQDATRQVFDAATYSRYAEPHDHRVLHAAREAGGWFNVIHLHGEDVLFDVLKDYPADALNWHIGETPPAIGDYRAGGGTQPIVGGLQRGAITRGDIAAVARDIDLAVAQTGKRGLILAPACVIRHPVNETVLLEIIDRIKRA